MKIIAFFGEAAWSGTIAGSTTVAIGVSSCNLILVTSTCEAVWFQTL